MAVGSCLGSEALRLAWGASHEAVSVLADFTSGHPSGVTTLLGMLLSARGAGLSLGIVMFFTKSLGAEVIFNMFSNQYLQVLGLGQDPGGPCLGLTDVTVYS